MGLITGPWTLSDLNHGKIGMPKNGLKVFSCFHCGGGSSMGYKLAGFDVIGGVEIDPEMMKLYRHNIRPQPHLSFQLPIQDFKNIKDLPPELFNLDILDGSPPCSSFSMAGSREKAWGEKKKFREGQAEQVLDDLFFHFIDVAKRLQPKVVVAENVKGLIQGNAKGYVKQIFEKLREAGYETQLFLLNSSRMGVPQTRQRTFFISRRQDLVLPQMDLNFLEQQITVSKAWVDILNIRGKDVSGSTMLKYWRRISPGSSMSKVHEKGSLFGHMKLHPHKPSPTMTSKEYQLLDWRSPSLLSPIQVLRIQSFPDDYDFGAQEAKYVCGMSVPPLMMQRVANQIYEQWFKI